MLGHHLFGEGHRGFQYVSLGQAVDQTRLEGFFGRYGTARDNHFKGLFQAHQPRQPLAAPGPRDEAEIDLRLAQLGAFQGDPVVTGLGQFQAAAEGAAEQRRHHQLGRMIEGLENRRQARLKRRLAKLLDIGPGHEGAADSAENHRLDLRILLDLDDAVDDPGPHLARDGVDRRIIDQNERNLAPLFKTHNRHDRSPPASPLQPARGPTLSRRRRPGNLSVPPHRPGRRGRRAAPAGSRIQPPIVKRF